MKITTPKLVLWAVVLISLFIFIEKFTNTVMVITILNGVFFGISFAVLIVYLPLIIYTIRHNIFDRVSQLSIGVGLIWLALVSPYTEFNIFLAIVGGVLFVSAPGYDNKLPRFAGSNRELMIILGITGGIITTLMYFIGTILY
jgi:hypothetical protein